MYPNYDKPSAPPEYLNQIAPQAPKKAGFLPKQPLMLVAIGAVIVIVITIVFMLISSLMTNTETTERLAARLITTASITDEATINIKSTQLRALNSELKIYLTNTIRDIEPLLTNDNIKIDSLDKKITESESSTEILAVLEDARLNATYDRTYAREMAYQLDTIRVLMNQIYDNTNDKELKSFLEGADSNLAPTQQQFADFNAANG